MKIRTFILLSAICCLIVLPNAGSRSRATGQTKRDPPRLVTLLKRTKIGERDNYTLAAFSFKYGVNGDAALKLTRNNWDLLFGNSPTPDAFDVTMVTDDCSRIKDLGEWKWIDPIDVSPLPAYPEPKREPSVKAIVGHMYLVHSKDRDSDHYALFRVESLVPGQQVTISWKLIPPPTVDATKFVTLVKRQTRDGKDNYTRAAFSFRHGINGDDALPITRNNWDLLFGNSPTPDSFDVTMVTDDCSRIKDLGKLNWPDKFDVPELPAYLEPTREPSVEAIVGHMYLVHTKDRDNDHYALFRVESLAPGESVTISWKLVPAPGPKG